MLESLDVRSATTSVWLDEPLPPRPALERDVNAEVCVIGAGVAGLSAAWHLLELGVKPVVVDAGAVAGGASGRNGGFFIAGVAPSHAEAVRRWGRDLAARRHRATLDAQRRMLGVAEEVGAREHFRLTGILRMAMDATEVEDLQANLEALAAEAFPAEWVAEEALPAVVRRPGRAGIFTPTDGAVHPVRWLRALADAVESRGARIFEGTRVTAPPAAQGSPIQMTTTGGLVHAERMIVAADAGLAELVPAAVHVRSRRLNMLATAAAPPLLPFPVYARDGHEYFQQLPDGRIALGGFSDLDGAAGWTERAEPSPQVQARLDAYLREELGMRAPVTHRWAGVVGYADDPAPTCGAVPGTGGCVFAAGGYNGTGHVQGFICGRILAELAATGASPDADLYQHVTPGGV